MQCQICGKDIDILGDNICLRCEKLREDALAEILYF